jgi:hypothetical protein
VGEIVLGGVIITAIPIGIGIYGVMRVKQMSWVLRVFVWGLLLLGILYFSARYPEWYLIAIIPGFLAIVGGIFNLISWKFVRKWPHTMATITGHRIEKGRESVHIIDMIDEMVDAFIVIIDYEYIVDSKTFKGKWRGSSYREEWKNEMNHEINRLNSLHPKGAETQIRYNRHDPNKHVTDGGLGEKKAWGISLVYSGVAFCIGGGLVAAGLISVIGLILTFVISIFILIFWFNRISPKGGI